MDQQSGQKSDQKSMEVELKIWECASTEKPKETWQLNVIPYNGWDPGTENEYQVKAKEI